MYKLFLCLRYLRRRRIAFFAIGAVTLCVAMVLIVISVMGGFLDMVRDRSRNLLGDIVIDTASPAQGIPYYQEFIDSLKTDMPDTILQATPVIYTYGLLKLLDPDAAMRSGPRADVTKAVRIVGLRLDETMQVTGFGKGLYYNKYYPGSTKLAPQKQPIYGVDAREQRVLPDDLEQAFQRYLRGETDPKERARWLPQDDRPGQRPGQYFGAMNGPGYVGEALDGVIIGVEIVALRRPDGTYDRWKYPRGSQVLLSMLPVTRTGRFSAGGAVDVPGRYVDDSRTGIYDIDSQCAYLDFAVAQKYLDMSPQQLSEKLFAVGDPARDDVGRVTATEHPAAVPDTVRAAFSKHGIVLSDEATIAVEREGEQWRIDVSDQVYTLVKEEDALNVYGGRSPARASQIQIKLRPGVDPWVAKAAIADRWKAFADAYMDKRDGILLANVDAQTIGTWEEKQKMFIAAVEKEKTLVTTLFALISVVAVLLVGCIFYMIVQEKTRDIGILKSVGASWQGVASVFLGYGAAVGVVGSILGSTFGYYFVRHINDIQDFIASLNPNLRVWSPEIYAFDRIPSQVKTDDLVAIVIVAIIASMIGALWAAWRAARVWPVEALRYE